MWETKQFREHGYMDLDNMYRQHPQPFESGPR